jgi:hypothetical protein
MSLHFESITHFTAQSNFRAGDFLSAHRGDFLALAERDKTSYLGNLFETVPLLPRLVPVKFVGESSGRVFHRAGVYMNRQQNKQGAPGATGARRKARCHGHRPVSVIPASKDRAPD